MRAALIDLFDTLVWSEWWVLRERLVEHIGVEVATLARADDETWSMRQTGGFGSAEGDMAALVGACGLEPAPELVGDLVDLVSQHLDGSVNVYEDTFAALRALRAAGVRTAVVSNCDHFARPMLERLGLDREVDALVLSCEVGARKPYPEIYQAALEALGAEPSQAVFVDDQPSYLDGAAALGIGTRYIRRPNEPWEGHHDPGDHPVIDSLTVLV